MRELSLPPALVRAVLRTAVRPVLGPGVPVRVQRAVVDGLARGVPVRPGTRVSADRLGARPAERVANPAADESAAVLYVHGGGWTTGSPVSHRGLAAELAAACGVPVYVLDYRLAPEHPYPAAVDDAAAAYDALRERGLDRARIAIAGDSAGGQITLALLIRLRDEAAPLPAAAALICPGLDLTHAELGDDRRDAILRRSWMNVNSKRYAGSADPKDPGVSPLFGDLAGLPPLLVHGCANDPLLPDAERLVARAKEAGVRVRYRYIEGLWHDVHQQCGVLAEAREAVRDVGAFLRIALAAAPLRPSPTP
jgi:monoterpene epsilon-lactone hydrolase